MIGNWRFRQVLAEFITQPKQKLSMIDATRASTFMLYMLNARNAAIFFSEEFSQKVSTCALVLMLCYFERVNDAT